MFEYFNPTKLNKKGVFHDLLVHTASENWVFE